MNVYDFDKTIYDGDASLDFWKFSVKRKPSLVLYLPYQVFSAVLFKTKIISRKKFKENFGDDIFSINVAWLKFLVKYDRENPVNGKAPLTDRDLQNVEGILMRYKEKQDLMGKVG